MTSLNLIDRLRARAGLHDYGIERGTDPRCYDSADAALDREAADALSRPPVTEEMVERGARVLADAIGEPVYTSETADVVRHILAAALGEPAAGYETYPSHAPAGGAATALDAALFGTGFEKVTITEDDIKKVRIAPRDVYLSAADREAAIRAEATTMERERAELLALRERNKWPKDSVLWDAFDMLAAAIRGGGE